MAKRKAEFDNGDGDDNGEERAVFVDTSLNTHLVLLVSHLDTFSLLKQKILVEHPKCFPDFGQIEINSLKVKQKGCYYLLPDSMLVKTAFHGVVKNWFLFADTSCQTACARTPMNVHATLPVRSSKTPATLVGSSKLLESGIDCEMSKKFDLSKVHDECKSMKESSKPGVSEGKRYRNKKRKKSDGENQVIVNENDATTHVYKEYMREMEDHRTFNIEHPSGDGDVQSSVLLGVHATVNAAADGNNSLPSSKEMSDPEIQKVLHFNSTGKEPPTTEIHLKSVGNDKECKNSVEEGLPSSPAAAKKHKVVNDNVQETSLLETKSLICDPNRAAFEPETINKSDGEDVQDSGLVDLNGLPYKFPKTSKATGKRKMEERHADAAAKVESVQVSACVQSLTSHLEDDGNNLVKDVQERAQQLEGTSTSFTELVNNEKGIGYVGLARGSKKSKKVKKGDIDGVNRSHPTTSSKVSDTLKNDAAPSKNENTVNDTEQDNTKTTDKSVQLKYDPELLSQQEPLTLVEKEREQDISPFKSLDVKGILDSENTVGKKKAKKAKKSLAEKRESCSADNHQGEGNHTATNGSADYHNKHGLTNEGNNLENKAKARNEIVDLGSMAKKKKGKKGNNPVAENPNLSSIENSKNLPAEEHNKQKLADEADREEHINPIDETRDLKLKTATISYQNEADGMRQSGAEALRPAETTKPRESVEGKRGKPKKKTQKKQTIQMKDPLKFPVKEQLGEKTRDPQADGDLSRNSNINVTEQQTGKDHHEKLDVITTPEIYTGLAEVKKLDKPRVSKQKVKKLDLSSSVDTSASGHNIVISKKNSGSGRTEDVVQIQDEDRETDKVRKIGMESLQLPPTQVFKSEENVDIRSNKTKKKAQKKQNVVKDPLNLSLEKQLNEEMREMSVPKSAADDLLKNSDINDSRHQKEVPPGKSFHEESNDFPPPEVSAGFAEMFRSLNNLQGSKQGAKKLDSPSSVDTSSDLLSVIKLKNRKGSERTSQDVTELHKKSIFKQKHIPKLTAEPPRISNEGIDTNPMNSMAKVNASGASSVTSGSSVRRNHHGKKAKELQKKLDDNHVGSKRSSHKNMGEVVNASTQRKTLLVASGAIFEDGSSASSDGEDKMDDSDSSTRTPSDNLSSSDYSEGESKGVVVTSAHDSSEGGERNNTSLNSNSDSRKLTLESILRSSSRYRKAKLVASQSQVEDGESQPVEFVPDSLPNQ